MPQRRVAGPEVIHGKVNSHLRELRHPLRHLVEVQHHPLRDLDLQPRRIDPRILDDALHLHHEVRPRQLQRRDVHRNPHRLASWHVPQHQLAARLLDDPMSDLLDQSVLFRQRNKPVGAHKPQRRMRQPQQRLHPSNLAHHVVLHLVIQQEAIVRQRLAHVRLDRRALRRHCAHVRSN